jgi:hypothetical protein
MTRATKLLALFSLAATLSFAEARSGFLVDAGCYERDEQNVTQKDPDVNHDRYFEVKQCAPKRKTMSFEVVQQNGEMFKLDSGGNQKAADLVRITGEKSPFKVTVNGERRNNTVKVDSIVPAQ